MGEGDERKWCFTLRAGEDVRGGSSGLIPGMAVHFLMHYKGASMHSVVRRERAGRGSRTAV